MPDMSPFFKSNTPEEEEIAAPSPFKVNPSLNGWDEEGVFDLDDPIENKIETPNLPPVVSSTISSEIKEEKDVIVEHEEDVITLSPENEVTFSKFFGNKEKSVQTLRPKENFRRDLLYAAQAYVNSFKDGNPLSVTILSSMVGKKEKELEAAFSEEKWIHFFKEFGIDPPGNYKDHLDERQLKVLQRVTNPLDARKLNTILAELGVKSAEWRIWMRQPEFKDLYNKWMKDGMNDVQGEVARQITTKATQGDPRAIENFLKLYGVNLQQTNTDVLIPFLLRELQQRLPKEDLYAFTEKLKELTSGNSIIN